LTHHISSQRHLRVGNAPNNFPATLATHESDLARSILQDPYNLDFLNLDSGHSERELEDALISRLTHFLSELGAGFAFVGRQYKITAGERDYFLDLLFFHLELRRFVVFELKVGQSEPEHIGKLTFYVNVVEDQLRKPDHGDGTTIGIRLTSIRDDIVVEYALRGIDSPLAVSTYTTYRALPDDIRPSLPTAEDLVHALRDVPRQ
jgi:predicted nuclease of restriction endonuclease-like (RecB) superfamily